MEEKRWYLAKEKYISNDLEDAERYSMVCADDFPEAMKLIREDYDGTKCTLVEVTLTALFDVASTLDIPQDIYNSLHEYFTE